MSNAIRIQSSSLMKKEDTSLSINLITNLMSKTLWTLWRRSSEFLGKKCTGRLLHFHIMLSAEIASKRFWSQNCFTACSILKRNWNSLERTSSSISAVKRMRRDLPWFLKFLDVSRRCISLLKLKNFNKSWFVSIFALSNFWRKAIRTSS